MGLSAAVRCRCWEEGKITSPPPFAEHVYLDGEGWLGLDLSWAEHQEEHSAFDDWMRNCCAHPDMERAWVSISNWGGYRLFQQQMRDFGLEHFPVLTEVLPEVNGGLAPAEKAAAALEELDRFCAQEFGEDIELVALDNGQTIQTYIEAYDGVFQLSGEGEAGVDSSGYFVRHGHGEQKAEVFRSMRFSQEHLGRKKFRLTDLPSGRSIITSFGVCTHLPGRWPGSGKLREVYPGQLEVQRRALAFTDFQYILEPLRTVFRASLETGNPVCWR